MSEKIKKNKPADRIQALQQTEPMQKAKRHQNRGSHCYHCTERKDDNEIMTAHQVGDSTKHAILNKYPDIL